MFLLLNCYFLSIMDINSAEGWFAAELDTAYCVPAVAVEVVGSEEADGSRIVRSADGCVVHIVHLRT